MKILTSAALLAATLLAAAGPLAAQVLLASATPTHPAAAGRVVPVPDDLAPTAPRTDEQVLADLVRQAAAATTRRDSAALGRLLATEYHHYTPSNEVATRQVELAFIGSAHNPFVSAALAGPVAVSTYGTTAITVSTIVFGIKNKAGRPVDNHIQMLMVWVQRDGRWQLVAVDSKELPAKVAKG